MGQKSCVGDTCTNILIYTYIHIQNIHIHTYTDITFVYVCALGSTPLLPSPTDYETSPCENWSLEESEKPKMDG